MHHTGEAGSGAAAELGRDGRAGRHRLELTVALERVRMCQTDLVHHGVQRMGPR